MSQSSLHRRVKRTNHKQNNRRVKRTNRKVKRTNRKVKRKIQHRTNRKQDNRRVKRTNRKQNNRKQNRTNRKLNQRVNRRIKKKSYKKISGGLKIPFKKKVKVAPEPQETYALVQSQGGRVAELKHDIEKLKADWLETCRQNVEQYQMRVSQLEEDRGYYKSLNKELQYNQAVGRLNFWLNKEANPEEYTYTEPENLSEDTELHDTDLWADQEKKYERRQIDFNRDTEWHTAAKKVNNINKRIKNSENNLGENYKQKRRDIYELNDRKKEMARAEQRIIQKLGLYHPSELVKQYDDDNIRYMADINHKHREILHEIQSLKTELQSLEDEIGRQQELEEQLHQVEIKKQQKLEDNREEIKSEFKAKLKKAKKVLGIGIFTKLNKKNVQQSHNTKLEEHSSHIREKADIEYQSKYGNTIRQLKTRFSAAINGYKWYEDATVAVNRWNGFVDHLKYERIESIKNQVVIHFSEINRLAGVDAEIKQACEFLIHVIDRELLSGGTQSNLDRLKVANKLVYVDHKRFEHSQDNEEASKQFQSLRADRVLEFRRLEREVENDFLKTMREFCKDGKDMLEKAIQRQKDEASNWAWHRKEWARKTEIIRKKYNNPNLFLSIFLDDEGLLPQVSRRHQWTPAKVQQDRERVKRLKTLFGNDSVEAGEKFQTTGSMKHKKLLWKKREKKLDELCKLFEGTEAVLPREIIERELIIHNYDLTETENSLIKLLMYDLNLNFSDEEVDEIIKLIDDYWDNFTLKEIYDQLKEDINSNRDIQATRDHFDTLLERNKANQRSVTLLHTRDSPRLSPARQGPEIQSHRGPVTAWPEKASQPAM